MTTIENLFGVLNTAMMLLFSVHLLACGFIAIGLLPVNNPLLMPWPARLGYPEPIEQQMEVYVNGWYYVTTSITTIGYGDIYGVTPLEKTYIVILEFLGILLFTMIQQRSRSLIFVKTQRQVNKENYDEGIDFIFQIDMAFEGDLRDEMYEQVAEYQLD